MKIGTDTNKTIKNDNPKTRKQWEKGKNPPKQIPTPKIQSCQIKLKVGIDTKTDTGNSKIMIPKPENKTMYIVICIVN